MDERYLKSTAIVRAYQKKMLDSASRLRLIEAAESAVGRLLDGTFYHNTSADLVSASLKRWNEMVAELIVEEELSRGLRAFFDFRNVVILAGIKNPPGNFYPDGLLKTEQLQKYIAAKKFAAVYEPLQGYLTEVFSAQRGNTGWDIISYLVFWADYFYYPWIKSLSPNRFWQNYWSHFIDLVNLRYLVRRPAGDSSFNFQFIPGGFLDASRLKVGLSQELKQFVQKPFMQNYVHIFDFTAENDYEFYRRLEKNIRKFLLDYLRPAKLVPYGLEPVFAFLESFLLELRNVNFIVRSKKMKIDVETVKENSDATYI